MIVVFDGLPALLQPVGLLQFGGGIVAPSPSSTPDPNFYIDNVLVKRDDKPKYSYN